MPIGKSKDKSARDQNRQQMMNNLGFGNNEMESYEQMLYGGNVEDDADLEAELAALTGEGGGASPKKKPMQQLPVPSRGRVPVSKSASNMTDMMKDVGSDDEDIEVAEDDPELLAELHEFVGGGASGPPSPVPPPKPPASAPIDTEVIRTLQERISAYQQVRSAPGLDSNQARRYDRAMNTLKDLLAKASKGVAISEEDMPPPPPRSMPTAPKAAPPTPAPETCRPAPVAPVRASAPPPPTPKESPKEVAIRCLKQRMAEYQQAALKAKNEGQITAAKEYLMVSKMFPQVIEQIQGGAPIDLSDMPPPPSDWVLGTLSSEPDEPPSPPEPPAPAAAPASAGSLLDALRERKAIFEGQLKKAQDSGDSSKMRRLTRIVTQFNEAITACQKRQPFDYNELPSLPGMAPLPMPSVAAPAASAAAVPGRAPAAQGGAGVVSKQLAFLKQRQAQFKAKALEFKQRGEIEKAKEYLRHAKGFDNVITAAASGMPVDLSKLPSLPGEKAPTVAMSSLGGSSSSSFPVECETPAELLNGDKSAIYTRLLAILGEQVTKATLSMENLRKAGDVAASKKVEALLASSRHDSDLVRQMQQRNMELPAFHFEWRIFSVPNMNPDLAEDEMEVTVVRGLNLPLPEGVTDPSQLDTYVTTELVFPTDTPPQTLSSSYVRSTNQPQYNASIKFKVANRKSRAFQRLVTTKMLKVDIYYKRGIFKKDGVLGSVNVKLDGVEKMCTVEEAFDVVNGRKAIGGRLEVRVRVREPLVGGTARQSREAWLIIDGRTGSASRTSGGASSSRPESVEVLVYERDLVRQKIQQLGDQLTQSMLETLENSVREMDQRINGLRQQLKEPVQPTVVKQYIATIEPLAKVYAQQAHEALQQGQREKAQICATKKKLVETEVAGLRSKLK